MVMGSVVPPLWLVEHWLRMAGEAEIAGIEAAIRAERERRSGRPPVLMCSCENFLECEHPWPMIFRVNGAVGRS